MWKDLCCLLQITLICNQYLPWNFVHAFMVSRGWSLMTLVIPLHSPQHHNKRVFFYFKCNVSNCWMDSTLNLICTNSQGLQKMNPNDPSEWSPDFLYRATSRSKLSIIKWIKYLNIYGMNWHKLWHRHPRLHDVVF